MRVYSSLWLCCGLALSCGLLPGAIKRPIRRPVFDPAVPPVEIFVARERGLVETVVIARNPHEANLFVTNTSRGPVSIELPAAVVAVPVLKQFGGPAGANNNGGNGGVSGDSGSAGGQPIGGGMSNSGAGNNAAGNGNNANPFGNNGRGFFTVPPEKTIQLPLQTVCLAHGRPNPTPRMPYQLVSAEEFTDDPRLRKLLAEVGRTKVDQKVVQAAAWHLADDLSWETLAEKKITHLAGMPVEPYFTTRQISQARRLLKQVAE